jgi:hypothetical protein
MLKLLPMLYLVFSLTNAFGAGFPYTRPSGTPTPPPSPPQQPTCTISCDPWEPNYPSICAAPFVTSQRDCRSDCSNGDSQTTTEMNCVPLAEYSPFDIFPGDADHTEMEPFKWDSPCKGQWMVTILTSVMPGPELSVSSLVSTDCQNAH